MYDIISGRPVWLWAWLRSPPFSYEYNKSEGVKDLHCTANAIICDCNKLTKAGESINMFVDA